MAALYVTDGYVDQDYVSTVADDTLYVFDDYVDPAYVLATRQVAADQSSSFGISAAAQKIVISSLTNSAAFSASTIANKISTASLIDSAAFAASVSVTQISASSISVSASSTLSAVTFNVQDSSLSATSAVSINFAGSLVAVSVLSAAAQVQLLTAATRITQSSNNIAAQCQFSANSTTTSRSSATLSSSFTFSATPEESQGASLSASAVSTFVANAKQTFSSLFNPGANQAGDWAGMGTWQEPKQEIWEPFIEGSKKFFGGKPEIVVVTTLSSPATVRMRFAIDSALSFVFSGLNRIQQSSATLSAQTTLSAETRANIKSSANFISTTSIALSSSGERSLSVSVNSTAQFRVTIRAEFANQAAFALVGNPISGRVANLDGQVTAQISASPRQTHRPIFVPQVTLSIAPNAGQRFQNSFNASGFASTFAVGEKYIIDPERIFTVSSESRRLQIAPETRLFELNSETRINMLEQELRSFLISSETRNFAVQHTTLVDVAGTPRDRREG